MKTKRILTLLSLLLTICCRMFSQSASFSRSDIDTGQHLSGGVAVGDFNGDGRPDLLIGVFPPSGVYLLLGNGDGTFGTPSAVFSGVSIGLTAADVNGDGKLDILFSTGAEVWVLLGNGDGTFNLKRSPNLGSPRAPLVMDFNRDGKPDLAFIDQAGGVSISLGNGDGTFGASKNFPITGGWEPSSLVAADFDGDGILDLAASNPGSPAQFLGTSISVLLGNGDGTFGSPVDFTVGTDPFPLTSGDFNGDGKVDLAVANYQSSSLSVLLGSGDGTFLPKLDFLIDPFPVGLASADFNGDGKPDFAVGGSLPELSIMLGNGDGTFAPRQNFPTASSVETLTLGDLNLDGKPDLIVVYLGGNSTLSLFLNTSLADTTRPTITTSVSPSILSPPNGRIVPVTISGTITDTGSGVNASSATYSVKDEYGLIQPSGAINLGLGGRYSFVAMLQASRRELDLNGRRYKIEVRAKDNAGNFSSKAAIVTVPHDHPK